MTEFLKQVLLPLIIHDVFLSDVILIPPVSPLPPRFPPTPFPSLIFPPSFHLFPPLSPPPFAAHPCSKIHSFAVPCQPGPVRDQSHRSLFRPPIHSTFPSSLTSSPTVCMCRLTGGRRSRGKSRRLGRGLRPLTKEVGSQRAAIKLPRGRCQSEERAGPLRSPFLLPCT